MKRVWIAVGLALGLAACAESSDKIAASYVSPLTFRDYSCQQLRDEVTRVATRATEVAGVQDKAASGDSVAMGIGLILFWPALFFLEGDTGREAELARLRGETDAIEKTAVGKNCTSVLADLAKQRELAETEKKKRLEKQEDYPADCRSYGSC